MSLWEYIKAELAVLRGAPLTFVGLIVVSLTSGIAVGHWHFSEQLEAKDGEIHRYRVALGIDAASSGALVELNNQELQAKALSTATKLPDMCFSLRRKNDDLQAQLDAGKVDKKGQFDRHMAINKEMSEEFARNLRADSFNVDNELRRRLGPDAVRAIVGITPSIVSDDGTRLDLLSLLPGGSGFDVGFTCTLADGIEQMAKLLPRDSGKP